MILMAIIDDPIKVNELVGPRSKLVDVDEVNVAYECMEEIDELMELKGKP